MFSSWFQSAESIVQFQIGETELVPENGVSDGLVPENDAESAAAGSGRGASGLKRRVIRNTIANWVGFAADTLIAFFLTPFLIHRLGTDSYGSWLLIGSLAGYFGMLDFGFKKSIGRFVAYYRGRNDHEGVLRTVNSAVFLLFGVGTVAMGFVWLSAQGLSLIFPKIAAEQLPEMQHALLIIGVNLAVSMVVFSFDATLWGYERFDLANITDCIGFLIRAAGVVYVVTQGYGLAGLAWTTLVVTLVVGLGKGALCYSVARPFRFSPSLVQLTALRELAPFGFWQFLMNGAQMAKTHLNPLAVGAWLGPAIVTPYSLGSRLVGYSNMLLVVTVNVLTPTLASLVGQGDHYRQRRLIERSGRVCTAYALFITAVLILTGRSFITLWVGAEFASAATILAILIAGEWLPMSVKPYNSAIMATAQQRPLAWRGVAECVVGLAGACTLGYWFGLTGFAVAFAIAATWFRGVFMLRFGGALLGIKWPEYVRKTIAPVVATGGMAVAAFVALVYWREPATWFEWMLYVGGFTLLYSWCVARVVLDVELLGESRFAQVLRFLVRPT